MPEPNDRVAAEGAPAKVLAPPFFILGCVRSGTTLLRDVLRGHPNLACPEETHFFRWSSPFGTPDYTKACLGAEVLKKHRAMDGITEPEFKKMLEVSRSRQDLTRRYMTRYIARRKPGAKRWFDKTPQNVYGAALIFDAFPGAKFVHIVRNPLDVVASLKIGHQLKVEEAAGACNYWNEAISIVNVLKRCGRGRLLELRYEDFTREPEKRTAEILAFIGESPVADMYPYARIAPRSHDGDGTLAPETAALVRQMCGRWGAHYGYFDKAAVSGIPA